jgi:RNA polymerase sigma-70 factor, ECF subfamily
MNNPPRPPTASAIGESFDDVVLPHLDAAYRLARWLIRNDEDAEDVVQEASLRALRYFRTFTGGNGRAWFLTIVRNTCAGWYGPRFQVSTDPFDEERHSGARPTTDPEMLLLHTAEVSVIERAMSALPDRSRALLVLREIEGLSYRELADAMDIPMGTVMSGLSRARQALRSALDSECSRINTLERTHARADACRLPEAHAHATARALETALAGAGAGGHSVRKEEDS